jgi:glycosyltransferase involved in cell wall biosynthesis
MATSIENLGVIAAVPFFSQSDNLNVDSNYAYLRLVLPEMARQSPDTLFLLFFPDPNYGQGSWRYTADGLQSDRVRFIPWPYDTAMRTGVLGFDPVRFAQIDHQYGPTTYWMNQVEMGAAVFGGYRQAGSALSRPVVIAQHHYIIHRSLPYAHQYMFGRLWHQLGGSVAADRVIYNSGHTKRMADEAFGAYLNKGQMNELESKSIVHRFGLVTGDEPEAPEATKNTVPTIIYNHRFEAYKQPDATAAVLKAVREMGHGFQVWVTQAAGQKTKNFPFDRKVYAPTRAEYLSNIAVPAINTINSVHETFCIAMLDSIMLGHLVVAPNAVTFPELVPDGYPYLFDSIEQQRDMLAHLMANFTEEYNTWRPKMIAHAREKFGLAAYVRRYLEIIAAVEKDKRDNQTPKDHVKAGADELFRQMKKGKRYSLGVLARQFQKKTGTSNQAAPPSRVVREASMRGIRFLWDDGVYLVK